MDNMEYLTKQELYITFVVPVNFPSFHPRIRSKSHVESDILANRYSNARINDIHWLLIAVFPGMVTR
jgi:hypothetical protein